MRVRNVWAAPEKILQDWTGCSGSQGQTEPSRSAKEKTCLQYKKIDGFVFLEKTKLLVAVCEKDEFLPYSHAKSMLTMDCFFSAAPFFIGRIIFSLSSQFRKTGGLCERDPAGVQGSR
jgi:hypothetical protein